MKAEFFGDVDTFYKQAYSFLIEREAENNLIFAILNTIRLNINIYGELTPLLIMIKKDDKIELISIQTPPFNLVLSYSDNLKSIEILISSLIQRNIHLPGVLGPKNLVQKFIDNWCQKRSVKSRLESNQRIYELKKVSKDALGKRMVVQSSQKYQDLILFWSKNFISEVFPNSAEETLKNIDERLKSDIEQGRFFLLLENNEVVSMARKAGKTPNGNLVNYVYTPPTLRRKGYATECVAYLSKHLLEEGNQFCFLFTDLANPISNSIYQRIGYKPVIDVDQFDFNPK
jgi:predicted GNAT family acetyltransferase